MLKQVSPLILIAAVTACSTPIDRRQANDLEQQYTDLKAAPKLTIPAGLTQPTYSNEYDIPELGAKADKTLIGAHLDIRPPLQVLPMAAGTRVEEGDNNIKIMVESIDNNTDLKQEIFDVLEAYFKSRAIAIRNENYEAGTFETDWITNSEIVESNLWNSDKVYTLRQRYQYHIDVRPHGRTGSVTIDLIEHEESYDGEQRDVVLSGEDKRRYTIDILNDSISYMSMKRAEALKDKRLQESLGIGIELVANQDEQTYWLADANFKRTWDRLRIVLPEMGFEIDDMDSNKGLFYLTVADDSGFWSSLWGDEKPSLAEGAYRLKLKEDNTEGKTQIHLLGADNQPLSNELVTSVYDHFSALMQEDRKKGR